MSPDLIITDMQMPKMDGGELIDALKNHPKTATIPVIILAGKQSGFEKAQKRADFAISKDIDIAEQLAKALQVTLGVPMVEGSAAGK
jgi:CheY-like chemotaxis protein